MIGRKRVYGAQNAQLDRPDDERNSETTAAKAIKAFDSTSFTDQWKSWKVENKIDKAQTKYKKFLLQSVLSNWFALTPGYRRRKELRQEFLVLLVFKMWKQAASHRKQHIKHLAHCGVAQARRRLALRARNECFQLWASHCFRTLYAKQKLHNTSQWNWFASQSVKRTATTATTTSSSSAEAVVEASSRGFSEKALEKTQAFDLCTPPVLKANHSESTLAVKIEDKERDKAQKHEMELRLAAAQTKCQEAESKYEVLQEKLRSMIERLEMEKRELFEQSEKHRGSNRELSKQLKSLKSEKLEFSGKLKIAFLHIEGYKQHIKCLEGEKQKMEESLNTLRANEPIHLSPSNNNKNTHHADDKNSSQQMRALKEVNADMASKLQKRQEEVSDLRVKVQDLEKNLREKASAIEALESEADEMQSALHHMKVYNEGLEAKHLEASGKNNLLKIELQTSLNTLQLSNLELEDMRGKISATNKVLEDKMHLEHEQEGLKEQVLDLSEFVATLEHKLETSLESERDAQRCIHETLLEITRQSERTKGNEPKQVEEKEEGGSASVRAMCDKMLNTYNVLALENKKLAEENTKALKQRREDSKYLFLVLIIAIFIPNVLRF